MRRCLYCIAVICFVATSCAPSGSGIEPTAKEQAALDAHVDEIFAGVEADDPAQLEADRQRVRDVHRIAYLVERYKEETGSYPLTDAVEGALRNVIIGDDNNRLTERDPEHYVSVDDFLAELQRVLGPEVALPRDPLPANPQEPGGRTYVYSVYGQSYGTAAMLYHPVGWSEGLDQHQFQYRLGSNENLDLPMLSATMLFEGRYPDNMPVKWRDPSMAGR